MKMVQKTILHIEDDPCLASLVKLTFEKFGFTGEILQATGVEEAFNLLDKRSQNKSPVDLILSDMNLPDGRGLDLLRKIKASPTWSKTPVIILSGDRSPALVSEAYALGANCYLSKLPRKGLGFDHIRTLYQFWIENALIPEPSFVDKIQEVFSKAINLRARIAQFYITLSGLTENTHTEESFWLERAMIEGNLSSLMLCLQDVVDKKEIPPELIERISKMQTKVELALIRAAQASRQQPLAKKNDLICFVLGLLEAWDEEAIVDLFGIISPLNQTISKALKLRGIRQLEEIADFILAETTDSELIERANLVKGFSARLGGMSDGVKDHSV